MAYLNQISKVTIKGYKSIENLVDFKLGDLNVLIGPNGAGKSNFISLFRFLNEISESRLQNFVRKSGGANELLYFGAKHTNAIEVEIHFGPNSYHLKLVSTSDDTLFFEIEECHYFGIRHATPYSFSSLSNNRLETGLVEQTGQISQSTLRSIQSWRLYHFHDTSDTSLMKKTGQIDDNDKLRADASNLAAYLFLLQEKYPDSYKNIVGTIRLIAPFFKDFILRPSPLNTETIQLEWRHNESEDYFDASSLSDGTLRMICLATLLLQPQEKLPTAILLDEPELGLHPAAILVLANLLQSTATKTQLIVSTQSVTLVNQLEPSSIVIVDRDGSKSTFRQLSEEELENWIDDYGLGDMWEKNIIGGRP